MQRSLDDDQLRALVDDSIEPHNFWVRTAKMNFAMQNLSQGVEELLFAFYNETSWPTLIIHNRICKDLHRGADEWSIVFRNRPFTHLRLHSVPERPSVLAAYEDDRKIRMFEMIRCPDQWQVFLKWMWKYGDDRLKSQAAIRARRNESRKHSSDAPRSHPRGKDTQRPLDFVLHRPLHHKPFKAHAFKGKKEIVPSPLKTASLSLSETEGEAWKDQTPQGKDQTPQGKDQTPQGKDQTLQEKDLNGQIATVPAGLKPTSDDIHMASEE